MVPPLPPALLRNDLPIFKILSAMVLCIIPPPWHMGVATPPIDISNSEEKMVCTYYFMPLFHLFDQTLTNGV